MARTPKIKHPLYTAIERKAGRAIFDVDPGMVFEGRKGYRPRGWSELRPADRVGYYEKARAAFKAALSLYR